MRRGRLGTAALIVASWAATEPPAGATTAGPDAAAPPSRISTTEQPIPADLRAAVERASRAGRIIYDQDQAPPPTTASLLIRARQAATAKMPPVTQTMTPVVVPAQSVTGEDGILVYFIAGTKQPKVAVFGKHYRVLVSADGRTVKRFEPLSKGALELPLSTSRPGTETAYLTVTHDLTDTPLETHVFASLLHRVPVFVLTRRGTWHVDGARITFLGGLALTPDGRPAAGGAPPACAEICASVLATRCPRGPRSQADCTGPCEQFRSGSCAKRFQALFDCAGAAPRFTCDAHGAVTVTGCESQFGELLSCLARQR